MTTLWLDPGLGASGDMVLGVLLGLGAPVDRVRAELDRLDLPGWQLGAEPTRRAGIDAVRATVTTDPTMDQPHRPWSTIDALLAAAELDPEVAGGARATFRRLAEVEAAIHRVALDDVHFHEVGAIDAIVDIVGSWSALRLLSVDRIVAGPVGLGSGGTVATAHGRLPVPAPATLALLGDVPVRGVDSQAETVTPTGAALLVTMVGSWGPIPAGRLGPTARGAGGRDPDTHPNVLTGILLDPTDAGRGERTGPVGSTGGSAGTRAVPAVVLATNLDDVTPELLGHVIDRLLAAGADDAWLVPIGMKKSRPGHELRVLCRPDLVGPLAEIVFAETGTLGLRTEPVTKHVADRHVETVQVRGCVVRIKVGPHGAKPEHDDLAKVAQATGVPLRQLATEALHARVGAGHAVDARSKSEPPK